MYFLPNTVNSSLRDNLLLNAGPQKYSFHIGLTTILLFCTTLPHISSVFVFYNIFCVSVKDDKLNLRDHQLLKTVQKSYIKSRNEFLDYFQYAPAVVSFEYNLTYIE